MTWPPCLEACCAVGPGHEIGNLRRRGELRVLALEVRFRHPTGAGAAGSNVDRDLRRECLGQDLLERRPAKRHQVLCHRSGQQVDGLIDQDDLRLMAGLLGSVGHDERHGRVGWIGRSPYAHKQKLRHFLAPLNVAAECRKRLSERQGYGHHVVRAVEGLKRWARPVGGQVWR